MIIIISVILLAVIFTGCTNSDQPEDSSSMPLVADFHYNPTNPTTNDNITFICTSVDYDGTIINRTWELGDGTAKYGKQIEHIYSNGGYYTVNLTIWNNKGQNALKSYIIYCDENISNITEESHFKIKANFSFSPTNPTTSDTIQFIDTSTTSEGAIIDWHWDFGDNTISTGQNPTHKYSSEGNYQITLTVKNDKNSVNSTTLTIAVNTNDALGEIIIFEEQNPGDIFMSPEETGAGYWRVKTTDFLEQFYQVYGDYYDFIVLVPTKIISSSYSVHVNSNTYGIGSDPNPNEPDWYPYIKRLKSLTARGTYSHYYWAGNTTEYFDVESDVDIISHEIGHHWLVYIKLYKYNNVGGHWTNNLDLFNGDARYLDIMAYYHWIINGDEEICVNSEGTIPRFSDLSLYLMGLIPAEEVSPIFVHEFEEREEEGIYQNYNSWGPRCVHEHNFIDKITVTIDDVIENYGERIPSYDISQKNFRVVFVILTENGEDVPSEFLGYIEQCRDALPEYWSEATLDYSKIEC